MIYLKIKFNIFLKRIIIVTSFIVLSIVSYSVVNILEDTKTESINTNATPIANKVIVIDSGHGLPDERCNRF